MTHSGQGEYSDVYNQLQPSRIFASLWQLGPICCSLAPSMDGSSLETIFLIVMVLGEQRLQKQTIVQDKIHFVEKMRCLDQSLCLLFYRPLWHPFMGLIWFLFSFWVFYDLRLETISKAVYVGGLIYLGQWKKRGNRNGRERDQPRLTLHLYEREKWPRWVWNSDHLPC